MMAGQFQQRLAPVRRHGVGGGALVAWCDEDQITLRQHWPIKHQPAPIHRQAGDMFGALAQNIAQIRIGWIFNHHPAVSRNQQLGNQIQRILGTKGHQNLFWLGGNAAPRQAARANVIDQHRIIIKTEITNHAAEIPHAKRLTRTVTPFGH